MTSSLSDDGKTMQPMVSERAAIMRERRAYHEGVVDGRGSSEAVRWSHDAIRIRAQRRYPFPRIKRPRVVSDVLETAMRVEWTVVDGHLRMRQDGGPWLMWREFQHHAWNAPLPERVTMWADLLANPTELVDADDVVTAPSEGGAR